MHRRLKAWALAARRDALAVWLAARDPRVPWYAKALALAVAAYVFSPIDLIPDFVPVLGLLDDIVVAGLGLALVVALVPRPLMTELREQAARRSDRPMSRSGAAAVILVWLAALVAVAWFARSAL